MLPVMWLHSAQLEQGSFGFPSLGLIQQTTKLHVASSHVALVQVKSSGCHLTASQEFFQIKLAPCNVSLETGVLIAFQRNDFNQLIRKAIKCYGHFKLIRRKSSTPFVPKSIVDSSQLSLVELPFWTSCVGGEGVLDMRARKRFPKLQNMCYLQSRQTPAHAEY
eukprot:m.240095 g.240095  ORF g.240095 m.240095 type:complete len:164 (+) comp26583_c0_seq20:1201-1692(+)